MNSNRRPLVRKIAYFFTRLLSLTFAGLARILPLSWLRVIATVVGCLICLLIPSRQRLAQENIRRAFGDRFTAAQRRTIARQATINICKTMVELLKMRHMSPEQIKRLLPAEGLHHIQEALDQGQGAIIITAHFGNWEWGAARLAAEGFPMMILARDANEATSASLINQARVHHTIEVVGREELRTILKALRSNRCLGILPDQHAAEGGIVVDFLGRPAATAIGPAALALRTGCVLLPCFSYRRADGTLYGRVFPPIEVIETGDRKEDIRAITQRINDVIGEQIHKHPEQWLWLHDRWKVDRVKAEE